MPDSTLSTDERRLFRELTQRNIRFMIVGMSAALLQGARGATEDIDIWFEDLADPRIPDAVRAAGGFWVSGTFGARPAIGGQALSERLDVVWQLDGLEPFAVEFDNVRYETVDELELPVLPLRRIVVSKRAAARPRDKAALEALEDALALIEDGDD